MFCFFIFDKDTISRNILLSSSFHHKRTRKASSLMASDIQPQCPEILEGGVGIVAD